MEKKSRIPRPHHSRQELDWIRLVLVERVAGTWSRRMRKQRKQMKARPFGSSNCLATTSRYLLVEVF